MSKILLINPPISFNEQFVGGSKNVAGLLAPLGLAYIAAYLENNCHKVRIIDGMVENINVDDIAKIAKTYDMVGITSITLFDLRSRETAAAIKQTDKDVPIVLGGPHPTVVPFESLKDRNVDYVIRGEGEITILELIDVMGGKKKPEDVLGLAFKKKGIKGNKDKIIINENRPLIKNLDEIPMPARHLLPMKLYKYSEGRAKNKKALSMISSRGCVHNCSFCSNNEMFRRIFRAHSPERVVEEMEVLIKKYKAKEIGFWDDNIMFIKKRVIEICNLIKERDIEIDWHAEGRVDAADFEVLKKMKESGCYLLAYGVESGSERILKDIGKNVTKNKIRNAFAMSKKVGLMTRGYFILGFIGETLKEMNQTIGFAKELNPDIATFAFLTPLPGTRDFTRAQKEGRFDKDYYKKRLIPEFNFLDKPIYLPTGIKEEQMINIHRKAYREFYFRPSYMVKQIKNIKSFADIKRLLNGAMAVVNA